MVSRLQGTYYAAQEPGPGIMLFHMCNSDRTGWAPTAARLAEQGFHVLTLDFRGFGDSGGEEFPNASSLADAMEIWRNDWMGDVEAGYQFFLSQEGVDGGRIGAGGASCGMFVAAEFARTHPEVKTIVLLSGPVDDTLTDYFRDPSSVPIFGAASEDDGQALDFLRDVFAASANPHSTLLEFKRAGHGTDMFSVEPQLEPMLVEWFERWLANGGKAGESR